MSNLDVVRRYYECLFSSPMRPNDVRALISNSFKLIDPLGSASSTEDYMKQLDMLPENYEMNGEVRRIIADEDVVAALLDFEGPTGPITYSSWFTVAGGKITQIENVYDPRDFLASAPRGD